jgi:hypothetical protein
VNGDRPGLLLDWNRVTGVNPKFDPRATAELVVVLDENIMVAAD